MSTRDEFSAPVKRAVALRAGYRCSFIGCDQITVGPSDESPTAHANIGNAAHIHAAAPGEGARRYLQSMTPEERSHIDNAIWMCASHAILIDRDEVTYTADVLRQMKSDHERKIAGELAGGRIGQEKISLIALGAEIVATGELIGTEAKSWNIRLDHFVCGGIDNLILLNEQFDIVPMDQRYILINSLGDGRVLDQAPAWRKENGKILISAKVQSRFPTISAKVLGTDFKFVNGDLEIENGDIATVSGIDALSQKIQMNLWHQKGDSAFSRRFGSRISEYFSLFGGTIWFEQLVKLEAIRLASIPYSDNWDVYTPFRCVDRVNSIKLLAFQPDNKWLPAKISLEVNGLGNWEQEIRLFIPERRDSSLKTDKIK